MSKGVKCINQAYTLCEWPKINGYWLCSFKMYELVISSLSSKPEVKTSSVMFCAKENANENLA